jgi:hypothetical protein
MIVATVLREILFPGTAKICLIRFEIPSVPALTISDEISFDFSNPSQILNARISCDSSNYDFSLRLESGVTLPSIEEIYKVINISRQEFDDGLNLYWAKPPGPFEDFLYGILKNNDSVPTGVVTFEFVSVCFTGGF